MNYEKQYFIVQVLFCLLWFICALFGGGRGRRGHFNAGSFGGFGGGGGFGGSGCSGSW